MCFSSANRASFESIDILNDKMQTCFPNVPILLIATKCDLENDNVVPPEHGIAAADRIGALEYLECSARTGQGVRDVFEIAVTTLLNKDHNNVDA